MLMVLNTALWPAAALAHGILLRARNGNSAHTAIIMALLVLAAAGYAAGFQRVWHRSSGGGGRQAILRALSFCGGLVAVGLALFSPLDRWSAALFAIHMIQHEMLMLIAAPLLIFGRPLPLFLWAFSVRKRASIARAALRIKGFWVTLLSPLTAWLLHALALWIWHAPAFFDAALRNETVHEVQHLSFLGSALIFWASMVENRRQAHQGAAVVYLFTTTIHTSVLGALITFATRPWYSAYLQTPLQWGLTALEDQQLGGLIMWLPGSLVYVGIALALLLDWIRASERDGAPASIIVSPHE